MTRFKPSLLSLSLTIMLVMLFAASKLWLEKSARQALGGDIEISRQTIGADLAVDAYLSMYSKASSHVMTATSAAIVNNKTIPVQIKSFHTPYPLYGKLVVEEKRGKNALKWFRKEKASGTIMSEASMKKLGVKLGDIFTVGKQRLIVSAVLVREPDAPREGSDGPPRMIVGAKTFEALYQEEAMNMPVFHAYRAKILPSLDEDTWRKNFEEMFPDKGWKIRDWREHAPWIIVAVPWMAIAILSVILLGLLLRALTARRARHG